MAAARNWVAIPAARPAGGPVMAEAIGAGFTYGPAADYPVRGASAFEAGGPADVMRPCSVLAELTGQALDAGMENLTDDELIGVLRAARRVLSWQAAVELAAVEELCARRAAEHHDAGPRPAERAAAELAVALTLTSRSAEMLASLADGVIRLPEVAAALAQGHIDRARAAVFAEELACLPWLQASFIGAQHLLAAPGLTTSQLRARLRRAVLAADPEAGQRRQHEARREARVEAWTEASGNGAVAGRELPAAGVLLADRHLTALAQSLQSAGMPGTLDQVRAAVFLALLSGQSPESLLPALPYGAEKPAPGAGGVFSWPAGLLGTLHLTMPVTSWLAMTSNPGEIAGHGPADAATCRELAETMVGRTGTRYCLTLTTPDGHPVGHACTKTPPPPGPAPPGRAPPVPPAGDFPAWIASLRIEWLQAGACDHSRQTSAYRPGKLLDHLLKIRNPTCTAPGCRRPAERCDIDHVIPFDAGGRTCECNCHPACRRHHRCKGSAGWHLDMPEPGVLTWRLPHGRSYTTRAEPYPV